MLTSFYLGAAVLSLANAIWMTAFPLSWYHDLPAAVPHTGPFNAHFIRDIGVAYALAGVGFLWCAARGRAGLVVHQGVTLFFAGHAAVHVAEIATGVLPGSHWWIDAPSVFLPAAVLLALGTDSVRRWLGEREALR